ncbi:hypothetical protein CRE_05332 [Caenorhabditis remanei]|uniref:Uncharacterized protein n=1 Tax=Caenorhabditis remanei TaxID=31234 RepID=E3NRD3_CAERE|nr:hypothetical protein CRE_05332 [Caenorhabditis remanei]
MKPMAADKKFFFLAARREITNNGTDLVLVDPWTGERYLRNETELRNNYRIELGDFVHACVDPQKILYNISKTKHTGNIWTKVVGNEAFVENVLSKLNNVQGRLVFQNKLFGDSLCSGELPLGEYKIKISLLPEPVKLLTGRLVHFQATDLVAKQTNPIVGAGFAVAPKKDDKIVGAGFQVAAKKDDTSKMRAVVLSSVEKPIGTHFYLWNLDSKTEGLFVSKNHSLAQGHHFEGIFKKNPDGRWTCQKYENPIEGLLTGGINPNNKIYFTVKIDKYQPAKGNTKYGHATAKYIGDVLEGDSENTKLSAECNGKMVNIQRRGIGDKDFVWMVTQIL